MQSEKEQSEMRRGDADTAVCPSCRAVMVQGMRFCRMCGYRLGEGIEEYAATRRFDGNAPPVTAPTPNAQTAQTSTPNMWAPMAPMMGTSSLDQTRHSSSLWRFSNTCGRMRMSWVMWVVLSIAIMTAVGVISRGVRNWGGGRSVSVVTPKSFLGVDGFETADGGGAFIEGIAAPDTPVERAGLLGGDIITSFDGKPVEDDNSMTDLLEATPPGKTVEVVFIRDGETKKTNLTTMAEREFRGLRALEARPGGAGRIGVDDLDRVRLPNTNIYGVELGEVTRNNPADIAGLKQGDIVTDFNGRPVRTAGDLRLRIYEAVPGSTVTVVVVRGGERLEIPVKVGRSKD
jgi:membrane-associated protease RseP (regulator of RpoE activity)